MGGFQHKQLSGLDCIVRDKPGNQKALVLLHGYGADFKDLCSLSTELDPENHFDWYFPNGTLRIPIGNHYEGRAWFAIDIVALEESMRTGNRAPFISRVPAGLAEASKLVQSLVEQLQTRYKSVSIGGFSQGAMVTCDVALQLKDGPAALIQLSGSLIALPRWEPLFAKKSGLRVFQSHGQMDPILAYAAAEDLRNLFQKNKYTLEFVPFSGAHEIPASVLRKLQEFLTKLP